MHSPARRLVLRRSGVGLLAALPAWVRAGGALPEADKGLAVARLARGRLAEPAVGDGRNTVVRPPAVFQAASLGKPIVATLVLRRVLRGELDLDQPLAELLPQGYVHRQNLFALHAPPVVDRVPQDLLKQLTARLLLSHRSGLPNWADSGPLRLVSAPGRRWSYSGEGYVLLHQLLLALTGQPLDALASVELFEPLGMEASAFKLSDRIAARLVPGHAADGRPRQLSFPSEIAASSLYTTAADYARFVAATLADEALLRLITQAPVPLPDEPALQWGLGWGLEVSAGHRALWHWGKNPGFRALVMADLGSKDAAVALAASEGGMPGAMAAIRQALPWPHPSFDLDLVR